MSHAMNCIRVRLVAVLILAAAFILGRSEYGWSQKQPPPAAPNPQAPLLKAPVPLGMQRGTTLDLTLTGSNLADPTGLWTSFPAKVTIPADDNNGKDNAKLRVRLEVPKDAPLGFHTIALATKRGMSNFRIFCIDDLPQVLKTTATRTNPQEIKAPCVVVGNVAAESSDWYKVTAKAGERLSFEVLGRRLGSVFDPQLTLYSLNGRQLPGGHSNDEPGLQTDPRLTYTFKDAGDYLLEIRDVSYRGGEDYHYRLRIGDFPCAATPMPLAAKRGSKVTVQFAGPQIDGVAPVEMMIPEDPQLAAVYVTPKGGNGLSGWPVSLALSDIDEVVELKPISEPAKATRVPVPGAVSARFHEKGDRSYFVFSLKKGQRIIIEAHTQELHSPAEVYMTLTDAKGAKLQTTNPMAAPRLDFAPTADGEFMLAVEHLHLWGGPSETYRITITPPDPGFDLTIGLDRFDVSQGGTFSVPLQLTRRGYAGPLEVGVVGQGLSGTLMIPAGPAQSPAPQPNQPPSGILTINCAADLAMGPHEFWIQAKAKVDGKDIVQFASVRAVVSTALGGLPVPPRPMWMRLGLAVTEKAPFTLAVAFDEPNAMPGKPANVTVTATRDAGFTGEIALTATGLPTNVTAMLKNIPANMNEIKFPLNVAANAAPGTTPLTIVGKAKHQNRDVTTVAPAVPLVIEKK
jgi:hypothetical protein